MHFGQKSGGDTFRNWLRSVLRDRALGASSPFISAFPAFSNRNGFPDVLFVKIIMVGCAAGSVACLRLLILQAKCELSPSWAVSYGYQARRAVKCNFKFRLVITRGCRTPERRSLPSNSLTVLLCRAEG